MNTTQRFHRALLLELGRIGTELKHASSVVARYAPKALLWTATLALIVYAFTTLRHCNVNTNNEQKMKAERIVKSGEVMLSTDKPFTLDFRNGDGKYGVQWTFGSLGDRCEAWDPDGNMPAPVTLGDDQYLDLNSGAGRDIKVLQFTAIDKPVRLKYMVYR